MRKIKFIFDLDGTVTSEETLPIIAKAFDIEDEISEITKSTISGNIPFVESFITRVNILSGLDVDEISRTLEGVNLNEKLVEWIADHSKDCLIATGNFDGWIQGLLARIPCAAHSSKGELRDGRVRLTSILRKEQVVRDLKEEGYFIVYVGDGNNDAEAMRLADVSIACGITHKPANSVVQVCDFAVYSEEALVRILKQISGETSGKSVILSCAGIGSRLGLGVTKSLLKINDITLIAHHLHNFKDQEDLRVVVGYQSQSVIEAALAVRKDVTFVFNHDYFQTKTGTSLYLGAQFANDVVLAWDGDFIAHPNDVRDILARSDEFLGYIDPVSSDPVFVVLDDEGQVCKFSDNEGEFEWSGPAQVKSGKLSESDGHVYQILEGFLPLKAAKIRGTDIDTNEDYDRAKILFNDWNYGNAKASVYYDKLASNIKTALETRNKAPDFGAYDVELVKSFSDQAQATWLELGAGTGLMTNHLTDHFKEIVAVEKYPEFSKFINESPNLTVVNEDILLMEPSEKFDLVTLFGVMNFFNIDEASKVYKAVSQTVKPGGRLIVKHAMGVSKDVLVDGVSSELQQYYFSEYRHVDKEISLLESHGFKLEDNIDIYPDEFNRWTETRYRALVFTLN